MAKDRDEVKPESPPPPQPPPPQPPPDRDLQEGVEPESPNIIKTGR